MQQDSLGVLALIMMFLFVVLSLLFGVSDSASTVIPFSDLFPHS
jgi:hypothetical protein